MRFSLMALAITPLVAMACGSNHGTGGQGGHGGAPTGDSCEFATQCGPTDEQFFDNGKVAEVRITFDQADLDKAVQELRSKGNEEPLDTWLDVLWGKWKHCAPYDNFVPVTMEYRSPDGVGNATLRKVGMRLRGTKGRGRNEIQGFKLDFRALLPPDGDGGAQADRRFAGETKISVLSLESDHSLLVQALAYKLMRDWKDVPAPRCNHLKVYVNGVYYALIQNVEEVDDSRFIKNAFKKSEDDGALYSCSGGCGYDDSFADLEYYGDTFADYEPPKRYEPLRQVDSPETELIPMLKCGDAKATPDDAEFKTCISEWIDVNEWLKLIAAESLMPTLQSFLGAKRNFYLYFKTDAAALHGGRFLIYSWDYDAALLHESCYPSNCDPFTAVTGWYGPAGVRAKLATRLTSVFKAEYCAAMNRFLHDVYRPEAVDELAGPLEPIISAETFPFADGVDTMGQKVKRDPLTSEEWKAEVAKVRDFIITHGAKAQAQVDAACSSLTSGGAL
jgi:spore coat protein CotH